MSKMQFTPSQLEAILSQEKNILVSAGAGSGKTAVMTERIVTLFALGKCDADEIAVITFTNAAAAEMKKRIRKRTAEYVKTSEEKTDAGITLDETARENLSRQLALIEGAQISTIHSLCMNIIKNNYYVSSCDPAVRPISGAQEEMLLQRAVNDVFEENYLSDDEDFYAFCDTYGKTTDDNALKNTLMQLYRTSRTFACPEEYFERSLKNYGAQTYDEFEKTDAAKLSVEIIKENVIKMRALFSKAKEYADKYDASHENSIYTSEEISKLDAYLNNETASFRQALEGLKQLNTARYCKKTNFENGELVKSYVTAAKDILGNASKGLKKQFSFTYDEYFSHAQACEAHIRVICSLVKQIFLRFTELKEKQFSIDFADMEHLCLEVLSDGDALKEIQTQYKYVFTDEYQDVNDLQEMIIKSISVNGLFTVGDVKQSIYGFRGAEPSIFLARGETYARDTLQGKIISMNENFRSQQKVTACVNDIFSQIMTKASSGIAYAENEKLISASRLEALEEEPSLCLLPNEKGSGGDFTAEGESAAACAFTARLVQRLLTEQIYDEDTNRLRNIMPSDIAVIGRSMNRNRDSYEAAIKELGIPVASGEKSSFFDIIEIALVMDIISVTDNSKNDIPLTGVMRSFIYAFTENELLQIREFAPEKLFYHECVYAYTECGDDEALRGKINSMLTQLEDFRRFAANNPVDSLLRYIYNATSLFSRFGALPDGKIRQQNLLRLKELASQYEAGTMKGLYNFLLYTQSAKLSKNVRQSSYPSEGVQLLTVHKSKGLEFNVVIVADCEKRYVAKEWENDILMDKTQGITLTFRDKKNGYKCVTLPRVNAFYRAKQHLCREEMRILYVAATRAKQKLFFVASVKEKKAEEIKNQPREYIDANENSFLDLLVHGIKSSGEKNVKIAYEEAPASRGNEPAAQSEAQGVVRDDILYAQIAASLSYEYADKASSLLPTKLSVSAVKEGITQAETLEVNSSAVAIKTEASFAKKDDGVNYALRRGNLTHALLEQIDLDIAKKNADEAIDGTLKRFAENETMTADEANAFDVKNIKEFLRSDLGGKLANSEKAYRELKFIMKKRADEIDESFSKEESILIQGVIDAVFEYENRLYLLDYKTDVIKSAEKEAELTEKYSRQIRLYNEALGGIFGKAADEAYICFLSQGKNVRVEG